MAIITVDTVQDETTVASTTSLREAILAAGNGDTIRFKSGVFGAASDYLGGTAINVTLGTMTIARSITIEGDVNSDGIPDVILNGNGNGGERLFEVAGSGVDVTVDGLTFVRSYTTDEGAVFANDATLRISNSNFIDSYAVQSGGSIYNTLDGSLYIANTMFSGNATTGDGGAIWSRGTAVLANTTIGTSTANQYGGGIYNAGTLTLYNSTLTGNTAQSQGGGIAGGGALTINNSIVAGNMTGSTRNPDIAATITSNGNNIFGSDVRGQTASDVVLRAGLDVGDVFRDTGTFTVGGISVTAGEVKDNGGPSGTAMILEGGPAQQGGSNADLPDETDLGLDVDGDGLISATPIAVDQRLRDRMVDGTTDIGAVDVALIAPVVSTTVDEDDNDFSFGDLSLREAIRLAQPGDTVTFAASVFSSGAMPLDATTITLGSGSATGSVVVDKNITIDGDADGDGTSDVVIVGDSEGVRVSGTGTDATLQNLAFASSIGANRALTVDDGATARVAHAYFWGNIDGSDPDGGAILANAGSTLVVANSSFVANEGAGGGAIKTEGMTTVFNSSFGPSNNATANGEGEGGTIYVGAGSLALLNSTITDESVGYGTSLLFVNDAAGATATISNSIIAGSFGFSASTTDVRGTITSTGTNIFGTPTNGSIAGDIELSCNGGANLFNLFRDFDGIGGTYPDMRANNGGLPTAAIKAGGLAVDAGQAALLPSEADLGLDLNGDGTISSTAVDIDGSGAARVVGGTIDIGAYEGVSSASTIVVSNRFDEDDDDYSAGDLSLREALRLVEDGGTIMFDPNVFFGTSSPMSTVGIDFGLNGITGPLLIRNDVTINGDTNGDGSADVTLRGTFNGTNRAFDISGSGVDVTLEALNIQRFTDTSGGGGAVAVRPGASLKIVNALLSYNSSTYDGGAVYSALGSQLTIANSILNSNGTSANGGAVSVRGDADLVNTTFLSNNADNGGALAAANFSDVNIVNATFTGNGARFDGGAIYDNTVSIGDLTLSNSIVVGNVASGSNDDVDGPIVSTGTNLFGTAVVGATGADQILANTGQDAKDVFALTEPFGAGSLSGTRGVLSPSTSPVPTVGLLNYGLASNAGDPVYLPTEADLGIDLDRDGTVETSAISVDAIAGPRVADGGLDLGAVEGLRIAPIIVDTLVDEDDGDYSSGDLSLREALFLARNGDTITFDESVFTVDADGLSNATITLSQGGFVLSRDITINGDVNDDGIADVTISGGTNTFARPFSLSNGADLTLRGLTLSNHSSYVGGGVARATAGTTLTAIDSNFVGNEALGFTAGNGSGGAIAGYAGSTVNVIGSTFIGNEGFEGGAIWSNGDLVIANSTFVENEALSGGGGAVRTYQPVGTNTGSAEITNATFTGNFAATSGGAIDATDAALTIQNTIATGNASGAGAADVAGTVTSGATNIFGSSVTGSSDTLYSAAQVFEATASVTLSGNTFTTGTLADNGGGVRTVLTLQNGPAQNRGDASVIPAESTFGFDADGDGDIDGAPLGRDNRGEDRVQNGAVDIGAVERALPPLVVDTLSDVDNNFLGAGDFSLREALRLAQDGDVIRFDPTVFTVDADPLVNAAIGLTEGSLVISSNVTIDGDVDGDGRADVTITQGGPNNGYTAFRTDPSRAINAVLDGLTVRDIDARASISDPGGLSIDTGDTVLVRNSNFYGLQGDTAGAIRSDGTLTMLNSTITNGSAYTSGGLFLSGAGSTTLVNTTVHGNAGNLAGGIYVATATATLSLINTTVAGNSNSGYVGVGGDGAGGIFSLPDSIGSSSPTIRIYNSILGGNASGLGSDDTNATVISNGANIFGTPVSGGILGDQLLGVALSLPQLFDATMTMQAFGGGSFLTAAVADNGGPGPTAALSTNVAVNLALDAADADALNEALIGFDLNGDGDMFDVIATDGRGYARAVDLAGAGTTRTVDIGAFEVADRPTPGPDIIPGTAGQDSTDALGGDDIVSGEGDDDDIAGADGNDVLLGGSGNDTLDGGADADRLIGAGGNDSLIGGTGNDTINAGNDDDVLDGGEGDNILRGEGGDDSIVSGRGADDIAGGIGDDTVEAGAGNDSILGQGNVDTLMGEDGEDQIAGGSGNDLLFGGAGNDTLRGQGNNDELYGGTGNDFLQGAAGQDVLYGGAGNDSLTGGTGGDRLIGGVGNDIMNAGAQADRFEFDVGHGNDTIIGFGNNQDTIEIAAALVGGITDEATVLATYASQVGGSVIFDFQTSDEFIKVNNFSLGDLADDILIV